MSSTIDFPELDQATSTEIKLLPPYMLIILNDEHHSFGFVVEVLCKVIPVEAQKAFALADKAHHEGRAVVWVGSKELAELKYEQITSFHEGKLGPLSVEMEPAE